MAWRWRFLAARPMVDFHTARDLPAHPRQIRVEALVLVGGWLGRGGGEEEDEGAHGDAVFFSQALISLEGPSQRGDALLACACRLIRTDQE